MGKIIKTLCLLLSVFLVLGLTKQKKLRREATDRELNRQAVEVETAVGALGMEEIAHQKNLARWYNYNLELGTSGLEAAYETILNFGQGRMAVLGVPEWELRMAIYHGGGGAVNHDPATPLPLGGRGDHTILYLSQEFPWSEGMSLYIDCLGQRITYRVESIQAADGLPGAVLTGEAGQNMLTLVLDRGESCTLIRCVRCGELVLRHGEDTEDVSPSALGILVPLLALGWIWRRKPSAKYARKGKYFGFFRKTREKTKLS